MQRFWVVVSLCATALWCVSASAATRTFQANLDGLQETPPNASPAFGLGEFTLNDITGAVSVTTGTYQDLLGGASAVHIHGPAGPGVAAPVLIGLTLDTPGAMTGTYSGGGTLTAPNIAAMIAGNTYVNLHSSVFPGGEIRGQLFEVPEPASAGILSLAGIALAARRRRA